MESLPIYITLVLCMIFFFYLSACDPTPSGSGTWGLGCILCFLILVGMVIHEAYCVSGLIKTAGVALGIIIFANISGLLLIGMKNCS